MNHAEIADSLIQRARYAANEFQTTDFALRVVSADGENSSFAIGDPEVEDRIRGYVYEGFMVSVDVEGLVVTITAKDG